MIFPFSLIFQRSKPRQLFCNSSKGFFDNNKLTIAYHKIENLSQVNHAYVLIDKNKKDILDKIIKVAKSAVPVADPTKEAIVFYTCNTYAWLATDEYNKYE